MKAPTGSPCRECPWRRVSTPGWLGPDEAAEWIATAHSDEPIACHLTITNLMNDPPRPQDIAEMTQCSGSTIYRSNVSKRPRDPNYIALEADRETVFASPVQFTEHHARSVAVIHALIDGRVLCGAPATVATVPPHLAQHATCRRCLASLRKP